MSFLSASAIDRLSEFRREDFAFSLPFADSSYELSDTETLRVALRHFFRDDKGELLKDQVHAADETLQEAVEHRATTPLEAFKALISTTAVAQEMDSLYAVEGGIDHYLAIKYGAFFSGNIAGQLLSAARQKRNVLEVQKIKDLMAREEARGQAEQAGSCEKMGTDGIAEGVTQLTLDDVAGGQGGDSQQQSG